MNQRENWIRAVEFRYPEWIPCKVSISPINWNVHREALESIVLAHPRIFPDYEREDENFYDEMPPQYRVGVRYRDNWGCVWKTAQNGVFGTVVEHPLATWDDFESYVPPDPLTTKEWGAWDFVKEAEKIRKRKAKGLLAKGNAGRLFDRLYLLRGFENLMIDIGSDAPKLPALIEMLEEYKMTLIKKWISLGVDRIGFHTDIGTQQGVMISPAKFRKYIKPMFMRLFQTCRAAGAHVFLGSDGNLLEIVDDFIECGVSVHDPQLRACTLEGIVKAYKGKMCAQVDLDRQGIVFMTPAELRDMIHRVVDAMAAPEGGLIVYGEISAGVVSLRNIAAICDAMEEYCFP